MTHKELKILFEMFIRGRLFNNYKTTLETKSKKELKKDKSGFIGYIDNLKTNITSGSAKLPIPFPKTEKEIELMNKILKCVEGDLT